ncbi:MAG: DUF362 domain-containing protein [Planctomycetota bacterium]
MSGCGGQPRFNRREFIKASAGAGAAMLLPGCVADLISDKGMTAATAIMRAGYDNYLIDMIEVGFQLVPPPVVAGKRVLLKINLVDLPRENKPIVTNPAMVIAAAEAFRRRGAAEVMVGDGPALQRDAWQIVDAVGLTQLLSQDSLSFVDLNTAEIVPQTNAGGYTGLDMLYFSRAVFEADVVVSMPKMKTHHWAGASLSMKNLFGTLSSVAYGWPRNIFHLRNPHHAVMDFNLTHTADYAIVDGITGLEGDGPVRGTPIDVGVIVMGSNLPAVDATASRIMGLIPERIDYLRMAAGVLGPIGESSIEQRGQSITDVRRPFQLLPHQALLLV